MSSANFFGATYMVENGVTTYTDIVRPNSYTLILNNLAGSDIHLIAQVVKIPVYEHDTHEIHHWNEVVKVDGKPKPGDCEISVLDTVAPDTLGLIWQQYTKQYNPVTGQKGLAANYKFNGRVLVYAPDGTWQRTWGLKGLFFKKSPYIEKDMDMKSSEPQEIKLELSCDKVFLSSSVAGTNLTDNLIGPSTP